MTATPELHILPTAEDTAQAAAAFIAGLAGQWIQAQGHFTIALTGGSTPHRLYQFLGSPPYAEQIAWDRWQLFWGDERCVPPDHQESNYRMAKEALLDRVPLPADNIHRIRGEATPRDAAAEYEEALRRVIPGSRPAVDLVLLGMGEDGHTASLFPGTDALEEEDRLVVANWVPHLQAHRITFTLPLINAASAVAFLVNDLSKAVMLKQVIQPDPGDPPLPAGRVRPASGTVHWFLTKAAASQLEKIGA